MLSSFRESVGSKNNALHYPYCRMNSIIQGFQIRFKRRFSSLILYKKRLLQPCTHAQTPFAQAKMVARSYKSHAAAPFSKSPFLCTPRSRLAATAPTSDSPSSGPSSDRSRTSLHRWGKWDYEPASRIRLEDCHTALG